MAGPVRILLVGVGGYGNTYVNALLDAPDKESFTIVGIVDPYPDGCQRLSELHAQNVPVFADLKEFYACAQADLAVIASPIHLHAPQTIACLRQGSHVICEKPVSATIQDARAMERAAAAAGRMLAIGYQWSYSSAIQALKDDVLQGRLGRPQRLRTIILWPRNDAYYARRWAGKQRDEQGHWILDSVANNATAHYLHNMLYILGGHTAESAAPHWIEAELYRAHDIENYDTAAIRVMTADGCELLYYGTHASQARLDPTFVYEFEQGVVSYGQRPDGQYSDQITAVFQDGTTKDYGRPNAERTNHLWSMIQDIARGSHKEICGVRAAAAQTICINGSQEACHPIPRFPKDLLHYEPAESRLWVRGLDAVLEDCFLKGRLPSEEGVPWARKKGRQDVEDYAYFGGFDT